MISFASGQAAWSSLHKDICIIIGESKEPDHSYYAVMRKKQVDDLVIHLINQRYLSAYVYRCGNCKSEIDSSIDQTCAICGWVICSSCGTCKSKKCESKGFLLGSPNGIF
ncbi:hypothetical protein [Aquibacillus saliphilus]|uniref:hypothetical protein n=1 Tax=Aquibacillus saliphilus TaxID=1909422 RepID=UPI001CF07316|nr:hypothetical protein [Aquibacillus saliphilus]